MASSLVLLLRKRRLRLKAEWKRRLREEPATTALANPDILVYLMDETLNQLETLLSTRAQAHWVDVHHSHLTQVRTLCSCGLNPLLTYFHTGGAALKAELLESQEMPELSEREKEILNQAWYFMAQREVESLCGPCRRVCAPALNFSCPTKIHGCGL
ncbi:MAG: hypothetical protein KGJ37_04785 [Verrucomicrobiota bacterium]|nr:hypothetical protein [Verrucomicrobiota bacterium]